MRQPVTLKIKFKSASLDQFIERYSVDVSRGGIFIRTKEPLQVGTQLKFEFQLQDASALISGEGTVVWIREHDPARTGVAPGMGVRFDRLAPASAQVLEQILAEKNKRGEAAVESRFDAGVRASASASGTLGAPKRPSDFDAVDSKALTPLPKHMPGLEGAEEEFGQESTRVMQDDVVARLAERTRGEAAPGGFSDEPTRARSPEELEALARATGPIAGAGPKVETKPEPPKVEAKPESEKPVVIASAPAPVEAVAETPSLPAAAPPPPAAATFAVDEEERAPRLAESRPPERKRSSPLPAILGIGILVAAGAGYFIYSQNNATPPAPVEKPAEPVVAAPPTPAPEAPAAKTPEPEAPAAKTPAPEAPKGPVVEVGSEPVGATVTVNGEAQAAPTPTTLTGLDPKKTYEVTLSLKGYRDWKGKLVPKEGAKVEAKLVANEKVVEVSSTPPGADVFLDGKKLGRTPYAIHKLDLSKEHQVEVRRAGFVTQSRPITAGDGWEQKGEGRDVLALALTLEAEARAPRPSSTSKKGPAGKKPEGSPEAAPTPTEPVEKPAAEKPAAEKPAAEKPAAEKPAEKPAAATPAESEDKAIKTPSWMQKGAEKPAGEQ